MKYEGRNKEFFELVDVDGSNYKVLLEHKPSTLILLWMKDNKTSLTIDARTVDFEKNDIVCITEFHQIEVEEMGNLRMLRFNRPFYCILDHDSEVGCKGILYYGSANLPIVKPNKEDLDIFETVWKMLAIEMQSKDNLQLEMLQMMLKRTLILCTRIYKNQDDFHSVNQEYEDVIREYNFLVESNFKQLHTVAEYADLLNKSPKTLSNVFNKLGNKSPLQYIHDRRMLEARRLLRYSDKPISEIGYEIGFQDIQAFSRFFKKQEGVSASLFREKK